MLFFMGGSFMHIKAAFAGLTPFERGLWLGSLVVVALSFLLVGSPDYWVLTASLLGATMLIFVSKGEPLGQLLSILFALFYGWISLKTRYYGEMITYLGMTAPMAAASLVSWLSNPFQAGKGQVRVAGLTALRVVVLTVLAGLVTGAFYLILNAWNTPNLSLSTLSITTSFFAAGLTYLRSPYYALAYAANDVVLIGLWVLAGAEDPSFIPMVSCFFIFLINDVYGFFSWRRLRSRQQGIK